MTKFQILGRDSDGVYHEEGIEEAHSAASAITKAYLRAPGPEYVAMVAVPVRSWKPTEIRMETTQRVVLGLDSDDLRKLQG
jgi:hypothetical protein